MYTYSCFTWLYSRNQHNIVKQLYSNKKIIFKKWLKEVLREESLELQGKKEHQNGQN